MVARAAPERRRGRPRLVPGETTSRLTVCLPQSVRDYFDRLAARRGPSIATAEIVREQLILAAKNRLLDHSV